MKRLQVIAVMLFCMTIGSPALDAATVAYWRFEPGNFLADSAGSNTLTNTGVASSSDTSPVAPGSGSASFNGSQTAFSTAATLDLSSFTDLTIECFFKTSQAGLAVLYEHTTPAIFDPGAFGSAINDGNPLEVYQRATGGTYLDRTNLLIADDSWRHMAMIVDGSETNTDRLELYVDGVQVGLDANFSNPTGTPAFLNTTFHIGSRLNTQLKYVGLMDELRISDTILSPSEFLPEPAAAQLVLGACLLLCNRRTRVVRR